ncbi:beta-galactosidase [Cohnella herbarum]|uniref:Glycoside hydrolase 35 catalytic domain-containing protein n=1 Tax=Cohnella herbarum TaxID=2728023 RepID=A0A7Z2VPR5_9BACL|nr:beta-galactosidase [Cohnella herbarum]QJD86964.1 hypothetical protein HH215_29850 [Cohnella herbarum]
MNDVSIADNSVRLEPDRFIVNGKSELILCASLFYFRIPRALWKERMERVKAFGYNAIDVYFPWNYHESAEGEWSFEGERDVEAFLRTAKEIGLWVVARPGPYICSEWDGGALPAYLLAGEAMKLRDNDPVFLRYVSRWFDRIMPILRDYQIDNGGNIIAVQLENELDFYGCSDPRGYLSVLRDMANIRGLTVPLIACAGQGGLFGATGYAEGLVPACNFYPNDRDPEFEAKVLAYKRELGERGFPLLVTETNRSHFLLRRLMSCGAKLLGPYLQVSGTDFGFTNAINNWGEPLAFMTSDYDFGGMISPEGHVREEAYEGKLLRRIMNVYGDSLTEAIPEDRHALTAAAPYRLNLAGGGALVFLTDLEQGYCPICPENVPLQRWGIEGEIVSSSAEMTDSVQGASSTMLVFHAEAHGEVLFRFHSEVQSIESAGMAVRDDDGLVKFIFGPEGESRCSIRLSDGTSLFIAGMDRAKALLVDSIESEESGWRIRYEHSKVAKTAPRNDLPVAWSAKALKPHVPLTQECSISLPRAELLETQGIYRGFAWYEAEADDPMVQGILIRQGSDVISLYADEEYVGTIAPGGASRYVSFPDPRQVRHVAARVEIWGHSNFDDVRLPSLRLHAMKGLADLVTVTRINDLTGNWRIFRASSSAPVPGLSDAEHPDGTWPIVGFGGWLSSDIHAFEYYRRALQVSESASSWTLHFDGLQALVTVWVNGREAGRVTPIDPYLDISLWISPEERDQQITLLLERPLGLPTGKIKLLEGKSATGWRLSSAGEKELLAHAEAVRGQCASVELPCELPPGGMSWLFGALDDSNDGQGWRVAVDGSNVKLTVFFNKRLVGRLWLPGGEEQPSMKGGSPDSFYVPGPWFEEEAPNGLEILLEAVHKGQEAVVRSFRFLPV